MNRRKFLNYVGCGCSGMMIGACSTAPITDRRQLKIIPESKLNAQAAQIFEKIKEKEKMSDDTKTLNEIKDIGKRMEDAISEYFYRAGQNDPTVNFDWEYILIDNKKKMLGVCLVVKLLCTQEYLMLQKIQMALPQLWVMKLHMLLLNIQLKEQVEVHFCKLEHL